MRSAESSSVALMQHTPKRCWPSSCPTWTFMGSYKRGDQKGNYSMGSYK